MQNGAISTIAHEFNLNNRGPDKGWMENTLQGSVRGLVCVTQDKSNPVTQMITIGRGSEAPMVISGQECCLEVILFPLQQRN